MIDDDIRRMASVLEALVRLSDLSVREVERRLDLGAGTLNRVFSGRIDLKMRHILRVLDVIGMRPERYFQLACAQNLSEDTGSSAASALLTSFERLGYGREVPAEQPNRKWSNEELDRRIEAVLDRILGEDTLAAPPREPVAAAGRAGHNGGGRSGRSGMTVASGGGAGASVSGVSGVSGASGAPGAAGVAGSGPSHPLLEDAERTPPDGED